mgnify:CR=1 FL=1|jgi:hypothetical protein
MTRAVILLRVVLCSAPIVRAGVIVVDPAGPVGFAASNAVSGTTP